MPMKTLLAASLLLVLWIPGMPATAGQVTEAKLGRQVVDRQIAGETKTFNAQDRAYLWLKVEGAANEVLTVTWKVNDLTYPTELRIGGSPRRTWASKVLHIVGEWSVTVTDDAGNTLHETRFNVQ
jgi:hypothetical protein